MGVRPVYGRATRNAGHATSPIITILIEKGGAIALPLRSARSSASRPHTGDVEARTESRLDCREALRKGTAWRCSALSPIPTSGGAEPEADSCGRLLPRRCLQAPMLRQPSWTPSPFSPSVGVNREFKDPLVALVCCLGCRTGNSSRSEFQRFMADGLWFVATAARRPRQQRTLTLGRQESTNYGKFALAGPR